MSFLRSGSIFASWGVKIVQDRSFPLYERDGKTSLLPTVSHVAISTKFMMINGKMSSNVKLKVVRWRREIGQIFAKTGHFHPPPPRLYSDFPARLFPAQLPLVATRALRAQLLHAAMA